MEEGHAPDGSSEDKEPDDAENGYINPLDVAEHLSNWHTRVTQFDAEVDRVIDHYESTLRQMFEGFAADLSEVSLFSTGDYFALMRAGQTAAAAVVIRSFAFHSAIGSLDILCARLVLLNLRTGLSVIRSEARLQRRARRRLRRPTKHAPLSPSQITIARMSLKGRAKAILERIRGVARALAVAIVLTVAFSVMSALVGKGVTTLLHNTWAGWLIGPVAGALLTLIVFRPLLKTRLKEPLESASRALLINLLSLMVLDADSSTRARLEGFLLTDPRADSA